MLCIKNNKNKNAENQNISTFICFTKRCVNCCQTYLTKTKPQNYYLKHTLKLLNKN